ncbi:hypothetical protein FHS83_001729 [Rhizomicrobium palustre]|uniref:Secreted protein n=1 Tax=Rhizomicrobium palustre TaxID=189966 RepID=A0A846MZ89_9PROT|nr:hypothetical protein [Rhizomicrobium palustre]NIK88411.1 hypothetical protein [Rhizomicrobium palustre]
MICRSLVAAVFLAGLMPVLAAPIAPGIGEQTAPLTEPLEIFTYRPANCTPTGYLLVFHGVDRNADTYRDDAEPLADRFCLIAVAPLFDKQRFPNWRYQHGGVVHRGAAQRPEHYTASSFSIWSIG